MTNMPNPTLSADALRDLQALYEKATPGPWTALTGKDHAVAISHTVPDGARHFATMIACADFVDGEPVVCISEEDRALICAAVNALPALLSAAGEVEKLRAAVDLFMRWFDGSGSSVRARWQRVPPESAAEIIHAFRDARASTLPRPASDPAEAVAPKLTGTIRNARWCATDHRSPNICGEIYGHVRFGEGDFVFTSTVKEHLGGNLFRTRSGSLYAVEWREGGSGVWPLAVEFAAPPAAGSTEGE